MKDFLIKIKSLFDGKGTDDATKSVESLGGASDRSSGQLGGLENASSSAANATRDLGDSQDKTNSTMGAAAGTIAKFAAAAAAAKGAYDLLANSVEAYAQKQQAVAGLDASLAARGQLTREYREELQALAGELQSLTAVGDDAWYQVFQKLTQFGADRTNIEQYTHAVKNLAGFMGGDVTSAAELFGRALEGNFSALSRYGIKVDQSASQTDKLNQLMEQLATRGGGVMEARARTLAGSMDQVNNVVGDLMASLGQMINQQGGLNTFLQDWIGGMERINAALGSTIPQVDGLRNAVVLQGLSAEEAARLNNEYADALREAALASTNAEAALNASIATAERSAKSTADMARAERDLALARIDADDSLSDSEKLTRKAAIEEAYRASTLAGEQDLAAKLIKLREEAATEAEARAAEVRERANQAALEAEAANVQSAATVRSAEEIAAAERVAEQIAARKAELEKELGTILGDRDILDPESINEISKITDPFGKVRDRAKELQTELERINVGLERQQQLIDSMGAPDAETVAQAEAAQLAAEALAAQADEAERAAKAARERAEAENKVATELADQQRTLAEVTTETARTREQTAIANAEAREAAEAQRKEAEEIARANREAAAAKRDEEAATRSILNMEKRGGKRVTGTDGSLLRDADGTLAEGVQQSEGLGTLSRPVGEMLNRPQPPPVEEEKPDTETAPASPRRPRGEGNNPRSANNQDVEKLPEKLDKLSDAIDDSGKNTAAALAKCVPIVEKALRLVERHDRKIETLDKDLDDLKRRVDNLRV